MADKKLYGYDGIKIVEVKDKSEALSPEVLEKLKKQLEK